MPSRLSADRAKVWLFYLKHSQGRKGCFSFNVIREVCSYFCDFGSRELAQVTETSLRFFNCDTSTWGPRIRLHTQIRTDVGSRLVILDDGRLFCCGKGKCQTGSMWTGWKAAYLISRKGTVDLLPQMLIARRAHGIIQVQEICVFGGSKL